MKQGFFIGFPQRKISVISVIRGANNSHGLERHNVDRIEAAGIVVGERRLADEV
jgi:hypothetical protein